MLFAPLQSFMLKISTLGLKKTYKSNSELILALNMIPALIFVSESKVKIGFELVIEEICSVASKLDTSQKRSRKIRRAHGIFLNNVHQRGFDWPRSTLSYFFIEPLLK